MAATEAGRVRG